MAISAMWHWNVPDKEPLHEAVKLYSGNHDLGNWNSREVSLNGNDVNNFTKIYKEPQNGHIYLSIVDVSEGKDQDSSVIMVFDITREPFEQVAVFSSNQISLMLFPFYINQLCSKYNSSFVFNNDKKFFCANLISFLSPKYKYAPAPFTLPRSLSNTKVY